MNLDYLDFEQPIAELQQKIEELRLVADGSVVNLSEEITRLEGKIKTLTDQIFGSLNAWQVTQLARHSQRPYALDYLQGVFT
ncbi:MAG: acetyl-CoA carboxylase carboxyl transferase subunit alpha, partial [Nevskiales bacterium]